ncbi:hypothetical protein ACFYOV_16040 [Streptomyces sp. NPDC005931]|uniref:hypothetical protein n=1 Tax=Streptomyces sp. NPDC005931 TaxID=3364737 RepID=UPI0036C33D59
MVVIAVALVVVSGDGEDTTTTPAPRSTTEKGSQEETREAADKGERADLVDFRLDDRSQAGITDIWVVWTIKNSSSEKSDYFWEWEAVDADGTRLENSSEWETDVRPGQTARGEFFTTLDSMEGVKLNVTDFNRSASY